MTRSIVDFFLDFHVNKVSRNTAAVMLVYRNGARNHTRAGLNNSISIIHISLQILAYRQILHEGPWL